MNAELVLPDGDAVQQIQRLRQARAWVSSCTEDEALDAKRQAELAREWVRIHKASQEIAIEACKLQATALRRLCQLGSNAVKGQEKTAGDWLAAMPDVEFDALLAGMTWPRTPISFYNESQRVRREDLKREHGRYLARGNGEPLDYDSIAKAANDLLHTAMTGGATTVNELTVELARSLERDLDEDYLMRQGIETVIREALRNESFEDDDHPDFVTWNDKEAGWLRIPWAAATLTQLRWMADYRQAQAQELQKAADELTSLVTGLEQVATTSPELTRLSDLWRELRKQQGQTP